MVEGLLYVEDLVSAEEERGLLANALPAAGRRRARGGGARAGAALGLRPVRPGALVVAALDPGDEGAALVGDVQDAAAELTAAAIASAPDRSRRPIASMCAR